jgi:hypothetical protein
MYLLPNFWVIAGLMRCKEMFGGNTEAMTAFALGCILAETWFQLEIRFKEVPMPFSQSRLS